MIETPRTLMKRVLEESPSATRRNQLIEFHEALKDDPGLDLAVTEYFFDKHYNSLAPRSEYAMMRAREERAAAKAERDAAISAKVATVKKEFLAKIGEAAKIAAERHRKVLNDLSKAGELIRQSGVA